MPTREDAAGSRSDAKTPASARPISPERSTSPRVPSAKVTTRRQSLTARTSTTCHAAGALNPTAESVLESGFSRITPSSPATPHYAGLPIPKSTSGLVAAVILGSHTRWSARHSMSRWGVTTHIILPRSHPKRRGATLLLLAPSPRATQAARSPTPDPATSTPIPQTQSPSAPPDSAAATTLSIPPADWQ